MPGDDARLVQQTLAGDLESYGELHRRYFERVTRSLLPILGEWSRAEDVSQEAYQLALESLPRLTTASRFYPWLRRIAVNRAIERTRRSGRRERLRTTWVRDLDPPLPSPTALDRLVDDERAAAVREAIEKLPERQRAALVLRFYDGLSAREAAEILDCREVTVRTNVFRALRRLGSLLGPGEESTS